MRFKNSAVVITGAAGGIGSALAKRFGEEGALLGLLDSKEQGLSEVANDLRANKGC